MAKVYLTGIETGEGMFRNEFVVRYKYPNGRTISGFFDKGFVTEKGLEITVMYSNENFAGILTPSDGFFETGPCIAVPLSHLVYE